MESMSANRIAARGMAVAYLVSQMKIDTEGTVPVVFKWQSATIPDS